MKTEIIRVHTGHSDSVYDITPQCEEFARAASGGGDGLLHVFVPHATAGVAVIELGAAEGLDVLGHDPRGGRRDRVLERLRRRGRRRRRCGRRRRRSALRAGHPRYGRDRRKTGDRRENEGGKEAEFHQA